SCAPRSIWLFCGALIVRGVSVFADEFNQLGIEHDTLIDFDGPRLRVRLWIVHGDRDFQASIVRPLETLGHFRGIAERAPADIKPLVVGEAGRFDDKGIAFPMTDRIAVPP